YLGYTLFRHEDVAYALAHPELFSSRVSTRHIAVPSGMDAPEHTAFRAINDKYYTPARMAAFAPTCRAVIRTLITETPRGEVVDIMTGFAQRYAMRIQNAFLGWPDALEAPLTAWIEKNRRATLARDPVAIGQIALEFDGYIHDLLQQRRDAGEAAPDDITTELLYDEVDLPTGKRRMTEEELISLLRNWTVGELSTISASVGIVVHFLAAHPAEQERLRAHPDAIPAAVEEIMRLEDPLVTNRRVTTCPVHIGGRDLPAGSRVTLNWLSANRDEAVFPDADQYRPERDQSANLVYGAGIHACPGAPLARLELRLLVEELLAATTSIRFAADGQAVSANAVYPVAGYSSVRVVLG
ncbi:cytochrome P450, partial [Cardiobacterium hominis]